MDEVREKVFTRGIDDVEKYIQWFNAIPDRSPTYIAYKGFNEAILADEAWNPLSKLNHVDKAREYFSEAISKDSTNLEIRLLRYSIELQIPEFLRNAENFNEDYRVIVNIEKEKIKALHSGLLKYIIQLLDDNNMRDNKIYLGLIAR